MVVSHGSTLSSLSSKIKLSYIIWVKNTIDTKKVYH